MQVISIILTIIGTIVIGGFLLKLLGYLVLALGKGLYLAIRRPLIGTCCGALSLIALAILMSGNFSVLSILYAGGLIGLILGISRRWIGRRIRSHPEWRDRFIYRNIRSKRDLNLHCFRTHECKYCGASHRSIGIIMFIEWNKSAACRRAHRDINSFCMKFHLWKWNIILCDW